MSLYTIITLYVVIAIILGFRLKIKGSFNTICIHNGIIYFREDGAVKSWNNETGEIIQEFRYNAKCITVNDQYLFIGEYDKLTVLDSQTNKTIILSNEAPLQLFIVDNKILSVDNDSTIKIWNLRDLKLFKEFKIKSYMI